MGACFSVPPQEQLFAAAAAGDAYMVSELLSAADRLVSSGKRGAVATVNAADEHGYTALHLAAERGHAKIVTELLARRASINLRTASGFTPLALAAQSGDDETVLVLLNEGAEVHHVDVAYGSTASMWAVQKCKTSTVEAMCAHSRAEIFETRNRSGSTMLIMAVEKGRLDTIKFMVRAGARASTKDSRGRSAASIARDKRLEGPAIDLLFEADKREMIETADTAKAAEKRAAAGGGGSGTSGTGSAAGTPLGRGRSSSKLQAQEASPGSMTAKFGSTTSARFGASTTPASSNRSSASYGADAVSSERLAVVGRGASGRR